MTDRPRHVYIVDDDSGFRRSTYVLLTTSGYVARPFADLADFLDAQPTLEPGCVLLDVRMPELDGLRLLEQQHGSHTHHPVVVMTGHGDVALAVRAMKLGAVDFIEKPCREAVLLETIEQSFAVLDRALHVHDKHADAAGLIGTLTGREMDVLRGLLGGSSNKLIAFDLGLSTRTVEMHRARMMERLGVRSLSEALNVALAAGLEPLRGGDTAAG